MGSIWDSLKSTITSEVKQAVNSTAKSAAKSLSKEVNNISKDVKNKVSTAVKTKTEKFSFRTLPTNVEELKALPEAKLDTPFKAAALAVAALCNYANDADATFAMLEFLNGPNDVSEREKQFIKDRLADSTYLPFSFFQGATPHNNYIPSKPYVIAVSDNEYSYAEENYATMYVKSSGADSPRVIKTRKKPSTNQWFVTDIQCLADIRIPTSADPWA